MATGHVAQHIVTCPTAVLEFMLTGTGAMARDSRPRRARGISLSLLPGSWRSSPQTVT